MRIQGIDIGIDHLAWSFIDVENGHFNSVWSRYVRTRRQDPLYKRINHIGNVLSRDLEAYHPDVVAYEEFFADQETIVTAKGVLMALGAIHRECTRHGVYPVSYGPTQIKQTVTTYGRSDKGDVELAVRSILGLSETVKVDHVSDAYAVAITHAVKHPEIQKTEFFEELMA